MGYVPELFHFEYGQIGYMLYSGPPGDSVRDQHLRQFFGCDGIQQKSLSMPSMACSTEIGSSRSAMAISTPDAFLGSVAPNA